MHRPRFAHLTRPTALAAALLCTLAGLIAPARAATLQLSGLTGAAGSGGFVIEGQATGELSGKAVALIGDVNGDGLADLAISAPAGNPASGAGAGRLYIVFGKAGATSVNLATVAAGTGGFVINGQAAGDQAGYSVAAAGDVNGDGLADILIGAPYASPAAGASAGRAYVVFGKAGGSAVNLAGVDAGGGGGFAIRGQAAGDQAAWSVAGAGDVNGDGLDDVVIGAPGADPAGALAAGRAYVVFGKAGATPVALADISNATGGFVINGTAAADYAGWSVAGAGDVNGDGLDDIVIGAYGDDPRTLAGVQKSAGRSYVVFGKADTSAVALAPLAAGTSSAGFAIHGQFTADYSGWSVAGAGDVNGDGLDDLVIGAQASDPAGGPSAGRAYVVFGKADGAGVDLLALAEQTSPAGFAIEGQAAYDGAGWSVAGAGDVNGDGLADVLIGAPASDPGLPARVDAGRSYLVMGRTATSRIDLRSAGLAPDDTQVVVLEGARAGDGSGWSVAGGADVNGDGLADLLIGAPNASPAAGARAGRAYVVFGGMAGLLGGGAPAAASPYVLGTSARDVLLGTAGADRILSGAGADDLSPAGGADVIYSGAGPDLLRMTADNLTRLGQPWSDAQPAVLRVDGGSGIDTLRVQGGGVALDLSAPRSQTRLRNLEIFNINGSGANQLTLNATAVRRIAPPNRFNAGNTAVPVVDGLPVGAGLPAKVTRHQLLIQGGSDDALLLSDLADWQAGDAVVYQNKTYRIWNHLRVAAQLLVQQGLATRAP